MSDLHESWNKMSAKYKATDIGGGTSDDQQRGVESDKRTVDCSDSEGEGSGAEGRINADTTCVHSTNNTKTSSTSGLSTPCVGDRDDMLFLEETVIKAKAAYHAAVVDMQAEGLDTTIIEELYEIEGAVLC